MPTRKPRPSPKKPKGKNTRVRLSLDERRTQLLDLGVELFAKQGYDDISIEALAEAAGIGKGLLYHYFGSKREFYVATIKASSMRLRRLSVPDRSLPPAARLAHAIDKHLQYIDAHGPAYAALYRSGTAIAPEVGAIVEEHRDVIMGYFLESMGITKPRPMLRTALRGWIAMVEGASLDWISHHAISRELLRDLLIAGYAALLGKTLELDPKTAEMLGHSIFAS
jgi:AcrR family transcriptional regulator